MPEEKAYLCSGRHLFHYSDENKNEEKTNINEREKGNSIYYNELKRKKDENMQCAHKLHICVYI